MTIATHRPLSASGFLISPFTQGLHNGWFGCSVLIRGKPGERLLRLTRLFRDPLSAAEYARQEGLRWIRAPRPAHAF